MIEDSDDLSKRLLEDARNRVLNKQFSQERLKQRIDLALRTDEEYYNKKYRISIWQKVAFIFNNSVSFSKYTRPAIAFGIIFLVGLVTFYLINNSEFTKNDLSKITKDSTNQSIKKDKIIKTTPDSIQFATSIDTIQQFSKFDKSRLSKINILSRITIEESFGIASKESNGSISIRQYLDTINQKLSNKLTFKEQGQFYTSEWFNKRDQEKFSTVRLIIYEQKNEIIIGLEEGDKIVTTQKLKNINVNQLNKLKK